MYENNFSYTKDNKTCIRTTIGARKIEKTALKQHFNRKRQKNLHENNFSDTKDRKTCIRTTIGARKIEKLALKQHFN